MIISLQPVLCISQFQVLPSPGNPRANVQKTSKSRPPGPFLLTFPAHCVSHKITLYNVCLVHRGMFSTSGGYHEYIGGIPWVHRGDTMSTSGGYHEYIGGISWVHQGVFSTSEGYHEYIGGVFSTSEGYHEYIGGCSVHRRDTMGTSGDIMSTSGDVQYIGGYHDTCGGIPWVHGGCSVHRGDTMSTSGGYHEYIGGISWVHRGMFSTSEFSIEIERILSSCSPTCIMISLRCTEHLPMYSWYPPDVLMVSLRCTEHPPMYSWYPPTFIMISPRCTEHPPMYSWYPPMYSWYPPDVLNTPRCTEHPPMYWTHIIQGENFITWLVTGFISKRFTSFLCTVVWKLNDVSRAVLMNKACLPMF